MPGAGESLLLLLLPAPRGSNAFSPCMALLPSAPEPQAPTLCPWPGQDLSSGHDHTLARSQELQCSSSTPTQPGLPAVRAGAGWEVLQEHQQTPATGTPFSWDRLIPAGAAVDAKGKSCLCVCCSPTRCWGSPHQGPDLSRGASPEPGGAGVDHSSLPKPPSSHVLSLSPAAIPGVRQLPQFCSPHLWAGAPTGSPPNPSSSACSTPTSH